MKLSRSIVLNNIKGRPVRTLVLVLLTALLSAAVFCGTVIVTSLHKGLRSLEARLGADVMVVPYSATTQQSFEDIVLQGATGYFYMDTATAQKVLDREGIGEASQQVFLATTSSGCCSLPVQIIGFDPETDFTVSPWIKKSFGGELGFCDVVVGNDLNAFVGDKLKFYGVEVRVAAKLEKTGTSYDTAVFTSFDTIRELIRSSMELGLNTFKDIDPDRSVSCLLINAADGYSADELADDINIHVKKVKAIRAQDMISGVSKSLSGVADTVSGLIAAVWILGTVILLLAFTISINERRREFAVMRVSGASRLKLASIVMCEAMIVSGIGSIVGAGLGALVLLPFSRAVENMIGLPFLLPSAGAIALYILAAAAVAVLAGAIAAAASAFRVTRLDAGLVLRGDN